MASSPQAIAVRHDYFIPAYKRALFFVLGVLITAACLYIYLFQLRATQHLLGGFLTIGLTTVVMSVGIFSLNRSVPARFVIDGPRLQAASLFGTSTADISQVEGFYRSSVFFAGATRLRLKQTNQTLAIPDFLPLDDDFRALLQQLTNLDQKYKETIRDRIAAAQTLGNTPGERLDKLESAKHKVVYLTLAILLVAVALHFGSNPVQLPAALLLALAPAVPLLMANRTPLLYAFLKPDTDPRIGFSFPVYIASLAMLLADMKPNVITWLPSLFAVPVFAAYAALFLRFDRSLKEHRRGWRGGILLLFCGVTYSLGLVYTANALLDRAQPAAYTVSVVSNHPVDEEDRTDLLKLAPWGPIKKSDYLHVDSEIYAKAVATHQVCVSLHPGFLHIAWYEPVACTSQPASAPLL